MTSKEANSLSIKAFLADMNIQPKRERQYYGMYYSPFRAESDPSMKVDYRKNLWIDFGSGEGGTMIDLVMKMERCTFREAMQKLEGGRVSSFLLPARHDPLAGKTILREVLPLENNALIAYLSHRGINTDAARSQCVEVHYSVNSKKYYAIGFRNDAGGYELRNRYFKGTVSPKGITTFSIPTDDCMVFEGFMDYLSYLTLKQQLQPQVDTVVLNSVVFLEKAMDFLNGHDLVHACLDNDVTGKKVLSEICQRHRHVVDLSKHYKKYKDLNEYLCNNLSISEIFHKSNESSNL